MRVTVFGGTGFLGKVIVEHLAKNCHEIRLAVRNPDKAQRLSVLGSVGQIGMVPFAAQSSNTIEKVVEGTDAVVNAAGILNQSKNNTFQEIHVKFPGKLAKACRKQGISKLVHVSSMGAGEQASSGYGTSKFAGEQAIHQVLSFASIVAPNAIFGHEDKFFNLFALSARLSPFVPLIGKGTNKLNPVYVGDVARFICRLLDQKDKTEYARYPLQGPKNYTMRELVDMILEQMGKKRLVLSVPQGIASLAAGIVEKLPFISLPISKDSVKMATEDLYLENYEDNALFKARMRITPIEEILPEYIM